MRLCKLHLVREVPFYTLLEHSRCQNEFDELVSMASRPVDHGFCRIGETKVPFYPVRRGFGRMNLKKPPDFSGGLAIKMIATKQIRK